MPHYCGSILLFSRIPSYREKKILFLAYFTVLPATSAGLLRQE
jgi:hypothetical protein